MAGKDTKVFKITGGPGILTAEDNEALSDCGRIVRAGGLVAFPTETVYGLGALATSGEAVRGIFEAKGRPQDNPIIVHVASLSEVESLVETFPENGRALAVRFWPGPLTLVMKSSGTVAPEVTAGLDTVGIRMPDHFVALELIRRAGPIAAPSANVSGRPSPTTAGHVLSDLGGRIDAVIDAGPTGVGLESTVLDISNEPAVILRPGGVTFEALRQVLPLVIQASHDGAERPRSPGQKYMHYAPKASLVLVRGDSPSAVAWRAAEEANVALCAKKKVGIMATLENLDFFRSLFSGSIERGDAIILNVGPRAGADEIAALLFATLRRFDEAGVDTVVAEGVQETEIGVAIMDRLARGASRIVESQFDRPLEVLFVCSGNTCRSPLAQAVFEQKAAETGAGSRVRFVSAGLYAADGHHATEHARTVAAERGLNLECHYSRRLTPELVSDAGLILTMEMAHRDEVLRRFPEARGKVFTLGEFVGDSGDEVRDPYGGSLDDYRSTRAALEDLACKFFDKPMWRSLLGDPPDASR